MKFHAFSYGKKRRIAHLNSFNVTPRMKSSLRSNVQVPPWLFMTSVYFTFFGRIPVEVNFIVDKPWARGNPRWAMDADNSDTSPCNIYTHMSTACSCSLSQTTSSLISISRVTLFNLEKNFLQILKTCVNFLTDQGGHSKTIVRTTKRERNVWIQCGFWEWRWNGLHRWWWSGICSRIWSPGLYVRLKKLKKVSIKMFDKNK